MSYEGFTQALCTNGHYQECDCHDDPADPCPECGAAIVWRNEVDVTNGSWDDDGNRIDGYIEMRVANTPVMCTCDKCGRVHTTGAVRYVIPEYFSHKQRLLSLTCELAKLWDKDREGSDLDGILISGMIAQTIDELVDCAMLIDKKSKRGR